MLKRILKKLGLFNIVRGVFVKIGLIEERKILYKIGNKNTHSADMDTLIPQMIEIGDNFGAAKGVVITAHSAGSLRLTGSLYHIERIKIGNNVSLGANSVVLQGVNIGDNVIVGAGAIVTKDIPANMVAVGNPARVICTVDEYIEKCKKRGVLYKVPETWIKKKEQGIPLKKPDDIIEFQEYIMKQVKEREQKK